MLVLKVIVYVFRLDNDIIVGNNRDLAALWGLVADPVRL